MTPPSSDTIPALSQLATDVADVIKGYDVMQQRASDDLRPIAERLRTLHDVHASDLATALRNSGGDPEDAGSLMGLVHKAVATGRDWFDALDASAIPQIIQGEERLLQSYEDALDGAGADAALRNMLDHQKSAIEAQVEALKRI